MEILYIALGIVLAAIILRYWRLGLALSWVILKLLFVLILGLFIYLAPLETLQLALMFYAYYLVYKFIIAIWHISGGMAARYAFLTMLPKFIQKRYLTELEP